VESSSIHSAVTGRERFGESSLRSTATVAIMSAARNTIEITMMEIMRIIGYSIERISSILRESNRATGTAVLVERGIHTELDRGKSPRTGGAVAGVRESRWLARRPGINWTGRVPRFRPKIGVDLRLSAADELFLRAFVLGRHLSLAADERRGTPINWIRRPSACWAPSLRGPALEPHDSDEQAG